MKVSVQEKEQARDYLRGLFDAQDNPRAFTILRHVSQSGMSRDISVKVVDEDGDLRDVTYYVALLIGQAPKDRNGQRVVRVNGCGMDMGFHLVYELSYALYKDDKDRAGYVIRHEWA